MKLISKLTALASLAVLGGALSGCAGLAFQGRGTTFASLYNSTQANEGVTMNNLGAKKGQACASSILGLVTTGDASVATAAKAGGITKVGSIDHEHTNLLGIYATYCINVTGD
jgi:hypothetical protein